MKKSKSKIKFNAKRIKQQIACTFGQQAEQTLNSMFLNTRELWRLQRITKEQFEDVCQAIDTQQKELKAGPTEREFEVLTPALAASFAKAKDDKPADAEPADQDPPNASGSSGFFPGCFW